MADDNKTPIQIQHQTKHKNLASIQSYLQKPTLKQKKSYAKSLAKYATNPPSSSDSDSDDCNDFNPPPPKEKKTKKKATATVSAPPNDNTTDDNTKENDTTLNVVPYAAQNERTDNPMPLSNSQATNNYMQMLKANPVGMFVGANLNNCTININLRCLRG